MECLKSLSNDPLIEDIVVSPKGIIYFREARWRQFDGERVASTEIWEFARQLSENTSVTLGLTQPSVDSFWSDSSGHHFRAHVVIHPLVLKGPEITLRRIPKLKTHHLSDFGLDRLSEEFLIHAVTQGKNILVAGSTGAGKTTFLTTLMTHLPQHLRILILEDSPELSPPTPFSTKLLSRQNRFGFRQGASWDLDHLVFESLRMRPDRIVLGECRGSEAFAIVTALQTGHSGVMATIHAGHAEEALHRFRQLAVQGGLNLETETDQLWDLLVHIEQNEEGGRRVGEIYSPKERSKSGTAGLA